jgi:sterol desaturase/sphingolipid hydroxylase (fatty acid hydroxylase superfamily)
MEGAWQHFIQSPIAPVYVAIFLLWASLMLMEAGYGRWRGQTLYGWKDTLTNLVMYAGYFTINLFWVPVLFLIYDFLHQHAIVQIGIGGWNTGAGGHWWEWVLLFVLDDLCYYVFHRCSHKLSWFWAAHVTHHSSSHFNLSVALRQTWTPFFALPFWLLLPWLGFDPLMVLTMRMISLTYQLFLHTRTIPRLGPLEWILNTPRHHQLHHAVNAPYLDRNFGGILIVWDRLFGTFAKETTEEVPRFGIRPVFTSHNPLIVAFHEWWRLLRPRSVAVKS